MSNFARPINYALLGSVLALDAYRRLLDAKYKRVVGAQSVRLEEELSPSEFEVYTALSRARALETERATEIEVDDAIAIAWIHFAV